MKKGKGRKMFDGKDPQEIIKKLENAFSHGLTDEQAQFLAGISESSFLRYLKKNPEFRRRKEQLKGSPDILAQKTIISVIGQPQWAAWWLKHKTDKFTEKHKHEFKGALTMKSVRDITPELKKAIDEYKKARFEQLKKELLDKKNVQASVHSNGGTKPLERENPKSS